MSLEEEFQSLVSDMYKTIQRKLDDKEISEEEARKLRDMVYDRVSVVTGNDNDSWCSSSTWLSSTEECY